MHSIETNLTDTVSPCPNTTSIGNGLCNPENNIPICNFDGGDCCPNADLIGNDECDYVNYNHVCHFDSGDCCYQDLQVMGHYDHILGDDKCSFILNLEMCNYDQGDCCDHSRIADGICDETNNNRICHFDGGDCCFGNKNTTRCFLCKCINVFDVILVLPFICNVLFSDEFYFHP